MSNVRLRKTRRRQLLHRPSDRPLNHPNRFLNDRSSSMPRPASPVYHAFTMIWPLVCRRLEGCPNISSAQLFDELCNQFPGRFHPKHLRRHLEKRVKQWRQDARARGVVIPPRKNRRFSNKPRGPAPVPYICIAHLTEMHQWLEEHPDQTAQNFLSKSRRAIPEFIAAVICVPCGDAYRSGVEKRFSG
jgi:hypothetical protein